MLQWKQQCNIMLHVTVNNINYLGLHVSAWFFLSDINEIRVFSIDFNESLHLKFHTNPSSGSQVDTCSRTNTMKLTGALHDLQVHLKMYIGLQGKELTWLTKIIIQPFMFMLYFTDCRSYQFKLIKKLFNKNLPFYLPHTIRARLTKWLGEEMDKPASVT